MQVTKTELDIEKIRKTQRAQVDVRMGERSYSITIEKDSLANIGPRIAKAVCGLNHADGRFAAIVTNPEIAKKYSEKIMLSLTQAQFRCLPVISFKPGDHHKTLETVKDIYNQLYNAKVDRRCTLIALGGGVVGDVAGFVAATYLRGIDVIQVPTTLLAQVDSSVGGKVGINYLQAKNSIGAFYQPKSVVIDPSVLSTLPPREIRSGLAEVIKCGAIADSTLFSNVRAEAEKILELNSDYLIPAIARSCEIKARVVEADEHETTGLRATLNFGHTVGHALEAVTNYKRYTHGEAIAIGMLSACLIGERLGVNSNSVTMELARTLENAGFNLQIDNDLDIDSILALLSHDKKSVGGESRFVLIDRIGNATVGHKAPHDLVGKVLQDQKGWPAVHQLAVK